MIKIGYHNSNRLHIKEYDPNIHKGNIKCAKGHIIVAKRGDIRQHHFCHRKNNGDDNCGGGTGRWHLWWQGRINQKHIELRFVKEITKIADAVNIVDNKLTIIEFQKSKMSRNEMKLRETFYTRRDLMLKWGIKDCTSQLIWVFNLLYCDIEIEHIFGDIVCFKWIQGPKFMCYSSTGYKFNENNKNSKKGRINEFVKTYYDLGKKDLIEIIAVDNPKSQSTKFLGQLISIEEFDQKYFSNILNNLTEEEKRNNTYEICKYNKIKSNECRNNVIKLSKKFYIDKDISIDSNMITRLLK